MVKNFKGGSKHKKYARKSGNDSSGFDERVRKSANSDEIYAGVTKILGNGRVEIICNDGKTRQCIIRNKFRGKNKRGNEVTTGTVILAGRRSWETPNPDKMETCDLLCVYNGSQVNKLKTEPNININLLLSASNSAFNQRDNVEFFDQGMPSSEEESETSDTEGVECEGEDGTTQYNTSVTNVNMNEIDVDDI